VKSEVIDIATLDGRLVGHEFDVPHHCPERMRDDAGVGEQGEKTTTIRASCVVLIL